MKRRKPKKAVGHAGDCTFYSSLINGEAYDGICTCGYGWKLVRQCDSSQMYSKERLQDNERVRLNREWLGKFFKENYETP